MKNLAKSTVNRWLKRGTICDGDYDMEELYVFLNDFYLHETRKNKHTIGFFIKAKRPLEEFTLYVAREEERKFRQTTLADGTRRFVSGLKNKEEYYSKRNKKRGKLK